MIFKKGGDICTHSCIHAALKAGWFIEFKVKHFLAFPHQIPIYSYFILIADQHIFINRFSIDLHLFLKNKFLCFAVAEAKGMDKVIYDASREAHDRSKLERQQLVS